MFCLELYDQTEIVCRCCSEKKHRRAQESWKMFADQHTRSMRPCNHWINSEPLIRSDWIRAAFGPPNKCCWQVTCMEWVAMLCQQGSMWCCEVSFEHSSNVFRNCANCWKLEHGSEINSWNVEKYGACVQWLTSSASKEGCPAIPLGNLWWEQNITCSFVLWRCQFWSQTVSHLCNSLGSNA